MLTFWVAGSVAVVVVLALWWLASYNRLVRLRNRVDDAWADIDAALTQRHDLIPNLVATVRGYAAHEARTLQAVTNARAAAMQPGLTPAQRSQAEQALEWSLRTLLVNVEAYPQLRAAAPFRQLMDRLSAVESTLLSARRYYNGTVRDYNTARQTLPVGLFAAGMGFGPADYFEAAAAERQAPQVAF